MKNWETLDADKVMLLPVHFTKGRQGAKIDRVVLHHNGGTLTTEGCYNVWLTREASAHYQVEANGTIGQIVYDNDTAWHAGDWNANTHSIGIEHADISTSPWRISDATLDNGAHLVAAICKYYKLGRPSYGRNVFYHSDYSPTECPASIAGSQSAEYMRRAQRYYDAMTGGSKPAPAAPPKKKGIDDIAREVMRGAWGNDPQRSQKLKAAGYDAAAVQRRVNELCGIATPPRPSVNYEALADAVIRGEYGNGDERRRRLGSNYERVQAIVNKKLGL